MPGRESSLRQIVDRVVDTITAWGLKDGYFVDAAEAAVFSDELKHLVVEQKAAFNSRFGSTSASRACLSRPRRVSRMTPWYRRRTVWSRSGALSNKAVGSKVLDAHGVTKVVAVKANGRKHVLRISTNSGHQLEVTADHLVWQARGKATGRLCPHRS